MKKLNLRVILILMLVLVLALSLVACGDKDNSGNNGGNNGGTSNGGNNGGNSGGNSGGSDAQNAQNVKNYFNTLWEKSAGIGDEAVEADEDLAISLDLSLGLSVVDGDNVAYENVEFGVAIDAILDRSSEKSSDHTAIKLQLYDAASNENWATVYYFLNDTSNIYVDFAGQSIKIPFSFARGEGKDAINNGTFSYNVWDMLFDTTLKGDGTLAGKSVGDIIEMFTDGLGEDWDLNALIGSVIKLTGIDLKDMLFPENPATSPLKNYLTIVNSVLGALDLTEDTMFDTKGNLNLKNILTNDNLADFFIKARADENGGHVEFDTSIFDTIGGMLGEIATIINSKTTIALDYALTDGELDGFDIALTLGSLGWGMIDEDTDVEIPVYPKVTISINDLELGKAPAAGLAMAEGKDREDYSSEIAIDATVCLDLNGISVDLTKFDSENYHRFTELSQQTGYEGITNLKLDKKLIISVNGKVDLFNTTAETNTTALTADIRYGNRDKIVELTFVGDTLAFTINKDVKIGDISIIDLLVSCWGDYGFNAIKGMFADENGQIKKADQDLLDEFAGQFFEHNEDGSVNYLKYNKDFKGGVWTNISIAKNANDLINSIIDGFGKKDAKTAADEKESTFSIAKLAETIPAILQIIHADEDGVYVVIDGSLEGYETVGWAVATIGSIWDGKMGSIDNFVGSIIEYDKSKMLDVVVKALKLEGAEYKDATQFLKVLFGSTAYLGFNIDEEKGIELNLKVNVNDSTGLELSIDFDAEELDKIESLAPADISKTGDGWFYYEFK